MHLKYIAFFCTQIALLHIGTVMKEALLEESGQASIGLGRGRLESQRFCGDINAAGCWAYLPNKKIRFQSKPLSRKCKSRQCSPTPAPSPQ